MGKYIFFGGDTIEISDYNGELAYSYMGNTIKLTEVEPGLYFSPYGDTLDFRGRFPRFLNIRLVKVNTGIGLLKIAFYAICGLVFLSALFYWPVRALVRRIRPKSRLVTQNRSLIWVGVLAALASLFSLVCLVFVALIPTLVYIPWMRPYADLLWWQFALLSLPFAGLLLALVIALLVGLAMRTHVSGRATYFYYLLVALALLAFNLALLI